MKKLFSGDTLCEIIERNLFQSDVSAILEANIIGEYLELIRLSRHHIPLKLKESFLEEIRWEIKKASEFKNSRQLPKAPKPSSDQQLNTNSRTTKIQHK